MNTSSNQCRKEQIAAYLDGELDADARELFENHLALCAFCDAELNSQRRFILALDSTLTLSPDLPLPRNFTQIIAARAESDMSGVRDGIEPKRAARFCLILALAGFALLGAAAGKALLFSGQTIADKTLGIFGLLWTTLHDAAVGLTVIARVIGGGLVPESAFAGLAALLLALAVVLLSLLIASYHRHREMRLFE
jgi:hypothetical protein